MEEQKKKRVAAIFLLLLIFLSGFSSASAASPASGSPNFLSIFSLFWLQTDILVLFFANLCRDCEWARLQRAVPSVEENLVHHVRSKDWYLLIAGSCIGRGFHFALFWLLFDFCCLQWPLAVRKWNLRVGTPLRLFSMGVSLGSSPSPWRWGQEGSCLFLIRWTATCTGFPCPCRDVSVGPYLCVNLFDDSWLIVSCLVCYLSNALHFCSFF